MDHLLGGDGGKLLLVKKRNEYNWINEINEAAKTEIQLIKAQILV